MALPDAVAAAAELGCIGELEGEPVVVLNLMLGLLEQLLEASKIS